MCCLNCMEDEPTKTNAKNVVQNICRSPNVLYLIIALAFFKHKQINLVMSLFLLTEYSLASAVYTKTSAFHREVAV